MNCYDPDLVHPRISDAVRDTLDHANTVEIPTPRERLISEFAALMTDPNVTDPLGQFLYGKDDHGTDSSPVEKRTDQDHHPKSDPVFFDRSTSADTDRKSVV